MLVSSKKVCILTSILALVFLLIPPAASGQASDATELRKLSEEELKKVLEDHKDWLKAFSGSLDSDQARSDKRRANLSRADLHGADLREADLRGANLMTNLSSANLRSAYLSGADLVWANLTGADLTGADLTGADLYMADLSEAYLRWACLSGAVLAGANLVSADLSGANLSGANLSRADLHGADLEWADLSGATLSGATLSGATLSGADLSKADLHRADLSGADLSEANLSEANLSGADLSGSEFNPKVIEEVSGFLGVRGLSDIKIKNVMPIVDLIKKLKEAGFKNEAKALTSVLRKHQLRGSSVPEKLFTGVVLGGFLTNFGANPSGALKALLALIFVFVWFYLVAVRRPSEKAGIWRLRPETRLVKEKDEIERKQIEWGRLLASAIYRPLFQLFIRLPFRMEGP